MQHLGPRTVEHRKADAGAVFGRVVVHAEGTLAKWGVDDLHDRVSHPRDVGVVRHDGREGLLHLLAEALVGTSFVLGQGASSAGRPEWAKWLVPLVKAPGTTIEVSMPQRASSRAYRTASASIAALAAK